MKRKKPAKTKGKKNSRTKRRGKSPQRKRVSAAASARSPRRRPHKGTVKKPTPPASTRSLAEKLNVRAGTAVAVLNCPKPPDALLGSIPESASVRLTLDNPADLVLLFVRNSEELGRHIQSIADKLSPSLSLWVAYPKQSSEIDTDLTRDVGWDAMRQLGWDVVSLVSVDDTWTAMRFKSGVTRDLGSSPL